MCKEPCNRLMSCGHICKLRCGLSCDDMTCQVLIETVANPACGHGPTTVTAPCSLSRQNPKDVAAAMTAYCTAECGKLLPCDHLCSGECKSCRLKHADCHQTCNKQLNCGHLCPGECMCCQTPIATRLDQHQEHATRTWLLGPTATHQTTTPQLKHAECNQPCNRKLPCGHSCQSKCKEKCGACFKPCQNVCKHRKCNGICGDPCLPCQEPCPAMCVHSRCTRPCFAFCNRPPCNLPCSKPLPCGHPCLGFCGEVCPSLCAHCDPQTVTAHDADETSRFVVLEDCQHVLEANKLDEMFQLHDHHFQIINCPVADCQKPILTTKRYLNSIRVIFMRILKNKKAITEQTLLQHTRQRFEIQGRGRTNFYEHNFRNNRSSNFHHIFDSSNTHSNNYFGNSSFRGNPPFRSNNHFRSSNNTYSNHYSGNSSSRGNTPFRGNTRFGSSNYNVRGHHFNNGNHRSRNYSFYD